MSDMTLLPTGGMGSGGEALAAAGGAFIGSWFGNGLNGNGFGRNGSVGADGVVVQNAIDTNAILQAINSEVITLLQGQNTINTNVERSAASTYTGLTAQNTQNLLASVQGFAGLNSTVQAGTNLTVAAIGSADRAALERNYQAQLAAEKCCCETNLNIERQGNTTRDLMRQQFADSQAVLICDLKSREQALQFQLSQAAQTAQFNCKINQVNELLNFKIPTPPTPPTGCC